jgi:hypothetical protein
MSALAHGAGKVQSVNQVIDRDPPIDWQQRTEDAWDEPGWREAGADYHRARSGRRAVVEIEPERLAQLQRLMGDNISLDRAWDEINRTARDQYAAPQATVEVLMFSLRRGVAALSRADMLRRLPELSNEQLREVAVRVQKFKPEIAQPWTSKDVEVLLAARSRVHG